MCHGTCADTPSRRCSCCLVRVAPSHGFCQAPKHLQVSCSSGSSWNATSSMKPSLSPSPQNWPLLSLSVVLSFPQHWCSSWAGTVFVYLLILLPRVYSAQQLHVAEGCMSRWTSSCPGSGLPVVGSACPVSWQECGHEHQKTWDQVCHVNDSGLA